MNDVAARVDYTVSAFKKAGFVEGGRLMLLVPVGEPADCLDAFQDAVASHADSWAELEADDMWIRVRTPAIGPDGPLAYVEESEPSRALSRMLEDVARGLEQRGVSGRLKPAPTASSHYFGYVTFPAWNAAMRLAAPVDSRESEPAFDWKTDRDLARAALGPLVEWMLDTDGPVYVSNGANFSLPPEQALDILLDSVARDDLVWMKRTDNHRRLRELHTGRAGWVSLAHYDADRPRLELQHELAEALEGVAAWISFGFIRDHVSHAGGESELLSRNRHPAPIAGGQNWNAFAFSMPLEADFVYDANVSQVVTTSQLTKMRLDPRAWTVRDLGSDRHSVQHQAPEAWFDATPYPIDSRMWRRPAIDHAVLTSAREDFRDAIVTRRVLLNSQPLNDPRQEVRRRLDIDPDPEVRPLRRVLLGEREDTAERRWWEDHAVPTLAAVLLLPVDLDSLYAWPEFGANHAWHVREDVARAALRPALEWVLAADGPATLSRELVAPEAAVDLFHARLSDLPDDLLALKLSRPLLERTPHAGLFRRVAIHDFGMAVVHSYDVARSKLEQLDDLLAILKAAAPHLTAGFVREVPTGSDYRHGVLVNLKPIVPYGPRRGQKPWDYAGFQNSAHLESEFVYDAFVAQVMTRQQYARTQLDPARWDVTELDAHGFAVQSRTPAQWFDHDPRPLDRRGPWRGPTVDNEIARRASPVAPEVLEAARAEFAEAIMSAQTLRAHPPDLPARHVDRLERGIALALGGG